MARVVDIGASLHKQSAALSNDILRLSLVKLGENPGSQG